MGKRQVIGASFRGVSFFVESSEYAGGRRTVTHEYPQRDDPFIEDMGRKSRAFPVEGYILGTDYISARNALITALEKPGPGELVHPYHGKRSCVVTSFRIRESSAEGGVARFSIEFEETPAQPIEPTAVADAPAAVVTSAGISRAAVITEFIARYSPGRFMTDIANSVRSATLAVNNVVSTVQMETQKLALLKRSIERLLDSVVSLVNEPADLVSELTNFFDGIEDRVLLLAAYVYNPGVPPPETTPDRIEEFTNFDAVQRLIQRLAVVRAIELIVDETFDSYDSALAARDSLTDLLDEQAEIAADDTYPTLLQLRADLTKAVPDQSLPRLLSHTPPYSVPSLVLAHRLYGNLDLEADLIARNHVRHPGAVPGGRELEILSD